ncbi:MAG: tetratricopeptide repeat protein [Terriglobales bacterium]
MSLLAGLALLSVMMALPLGAQQFGGIRGSVIGLSGKLLPNAKVTLVPADKSLNTVTLKTDKKGQFYDTRVPAGTYNMFIVSETGQNIQVEQGMTIVAGKMVRPDAPLNLKVLAAAINGGPPPPGMSKAEAAEYAAHKKASESKNAKIGQLNTLLAQNKQFVDAKQYPQAIAVMKQAVTIDQTHDVLFANLAEDYADAKDYKDAADAYQKAIALKPTDAGYVINLGSVLAQSGDTAGANAAFNKAATMDPAQAQLAIYNEGVVLMNANKIPGAEAAFDKVVAMDPTNANAWYYKGMCLLNQATTDPKTNKMVPVPGTREAFEKVIQLAPTSPNAQTAKSILSTFGGSGK